MILRWLFSSKVRQATAMRHHVHKLLNHQRDILSPEAVKAIQDALADLKRATAGQTDTAQFEITTATQSSKGVAQDSRSNAGQDSKSAAPRASKSAAPKPSGAPPASKSAPEKTPLDTQMEKLETVANKWLKPYPHPVWRENIEVLLVALAVAMGIRTFFLQPFKIPTGSMQPTLFGVTSENLLTGEHAKIPTGWERVREWFEGISYVHVVAENDGLLESIEEPPTRFLIFNIKQTLVVGGQPYTIWFPPDYGAPPYGTLQARASLLIGQAFHKGEDIVKLRVTAGDHLFVDRVTYNFRQPDRGEIVVFETKGIPDEYRLRYGIPGDQFYIKRLVGLGGNRIQLGSDRHLIINGQRLTASTPHFEKVYSFNPKEPPRESHYSGHVGRPEAAPFFQDHPDGVQIPKGHYMVMGDNTMNSLDSRYWGYFPAQYVIGKSFFVYWPLTERFGWGYHR
ncbi:Signal peptidase I (modular protein) [Verrucomicrobia bacterium]|nr:Signal peptidase I (modular protein) [Verrucomicrobiota bacterium]